MVDARVRPFARVADLVDYLLYDSSRPTTLIVCSTRAKFLEQLAASVSKRIRESQDQISSEEPLHSLEANRESIQSRPPDPLLTKTIGILANSRSVRLVFCTSLEHLRAYLSSLGTGLRKGSAGQDTARGTRIVVVDLVALHYMSTEFSAQGLLRTLALAVETAARITSSLVLCECEDAMVARNPNRGQRLWDLHVPIVSGTARLQDGVRQITVKQVAQRWFRFEGEDRITVERGASKD
ncbi:hypothetical protein BGW36DRAFT_285067 [Talaromyces proteolyticus]|uniref:Uncharacterized protein n=1 Tax=Talaromyces proteolyticus TaxID=1131652 RepID=A0AAD4L2N5_9EURO|nr:uncharacterized protein BGW36DRAFT_285067 [Talaromyces proteolyticus]KAH8705501.1 hypothetical protein BGW36DRAFT_285067 [Talaromyces proteolyticus]